MTMKERLGASLGRPRKYGILQKFLGNIFSLRGGLDCLMKLHEQ
jgi:hypothetical protein